MIKIEYPKYQFKTKKENGVEFIFDAYRKRWMILTPEEWVRQNILHYLTRVKMYPAKLIAVEKEISMGELKKRCDAVVYSRNALPWMIIECKEMNVPLTANTLAQALRYHSVLPAEYLVITNGSHCYGFEKRVGQFYEINELPLYP